MTEISVMKPRLPAAVEQFVLRWGDMGGEWGVNRSVAQIHALLYLSERPLTAEEIADTLGIARSNVSNSIRDLMTRKLIHRAPVLGDRRDHFIAETDLWQMVACIAQARKEREIDPIVGVLRQVTDAADADPYVGKVAKGRLKEMQEFVGTVSNWYGQMSAVPPGKLMALMRLGSKIVNLMEFGRKKGPKKEKTS